MDDRYNIINDETKDIFTKIDEQINAFWEWSKVVSKYPEAKEIMKKFSEDHVEYVRRRAIEALHFSQGGKLNE